MRHAGEIFFVRLAGEISTVVRRGVRTLRALWKNRILPHLAFTTERERVERDLPVNAGSD